MGINLGFIGLVVTDMGAALAFYRKLGIDIPDGVDGEPHVDVALPSGLRIAFDTIDVIRSFDPAWTAPSGGHRVALAFDCGSPSGVDSTYAMLVEAGYNGHHEPWDAFWGQRYAVIHDPDANAVELYAAVPPQAASN